MNYVYAEEFYLAHQIMSLVNFGYHIEKIEVEYIDKKWFKIYFKGED